MEAVQGSALGRDQPVRHVLFAEDGKSLPLYTVNLGRKLAKAGFGTEFVTAVTPKAAIGRLNAQRFDAVVVDLRFGSAGSGNEILRELDPRTPAFVFSGYCQDLLDEFRTRPRTYLVPSKRIGPLCDSIVESRSGLVEEASPASADPSTPTGSSHIHFEERATKLASAINRSADPDAKAALRDELRRLREEQAAFHSRGFSHNLDSLDLDEVYASAERLLQRYEGTATED